jgi:hypothetical protein
MFLATVNRVKGLLHLTFIGQVSPEDLAQSAAEVQSLLTDLQPGFVVLTDLSRLEAMDVVCEKHIGRIMDLCQQRGVGRIIRVIPEPSKDIGWNILSIFHYERGLHAITCESLPQAERHLVADIKPA